MADRANLSLPLNRAGEPTPEPDVEAANHARNAGSFGRLLRQTSGQDDAASCQSMEWTNMSFQVGEKHILKNITGILEPGRLTAVFGPSGSGKTTLLNILGGRQRTGGNAPMSGEVSVSGTSISVADFKSNIAYVMQDDRLLATETPRECIEFSAYLRNPGASDERAALVQTMLTTLGLNKCANTIVGSALLKGISGGERKRTSVGIELITNPRMLFLDEPLSGLDSYAAYTLVQALKELAQAGVPALCTVHQPSSEIFAMFDDCIILHDGEVVFHGPVGALAPHFNRWEKCPPNFNPADHVMFLLQKDAEHNAGRIVEMKSAWLASDLYKSMQGRIQALRAAGGPGPQALRSRQGRKQLGFCRQLAVLTAREARGTLRNKGILGARFGMSIFLALLYAWLFAGSASGDDDISPGGSCATADFEPSACASDFLAHYGTLVSLAISAMMGSAQPILLSFPNERPVFLREHAAQQYNVMPYFISKTFVEMPVVLASQLICYLCSYWIMGLRGNFLELVMISWALGVTSSSLALVIGCGVSSGEKAIQLAPLALIPQMLFSGLFLPVSKIPSSLQWVKWLCPLKYAINLATITEFQFVKERIDECERTDGKACRGLYPGDYLRQGLIQQQGVQWNDWMMDLIILAGLFVGFRVIATILLWRKGKFVF